MSGLTGKGVILTEKKQGTGLNRRASRVRLIIAIESNNVIQSNRTIFIEWPVVSQLVR